MIDKFGYAPASTKEAQSAASANGLGPAIERIRSLHDGDRGVVEAASHGACAIPALRQLLFETDRSGFFETRLRAVEALVLIGAHDVLIEFLESCREIADPVARLGEDAIINAAARALSGVEEPRVFPLLMSLAEKRIRPGIIAALGAFRRVESIPHLVAALAEDESRPSAEAALLDLGEAARDALLATARREPFTDCESESRLRQRRSALALLAQIGVPPQAWRRLREIMQDRDPRIRQLACQIRPLESERPERSAASDRPRQAFDADRADS
jgi:HEAT repeat protein